MTTRPPDTLGPPATARTAPRSLAPDLARGTMLLVIALAHAQVLSTALPGAAALDLSGAAAHTVAAAHTLLVDSRGYPMFAALFGYGLVRIASRRRASGSSPREVRGLLRRRGGWMVLIGFCHVALLFYGDIIAAYGLLAVAAAGALAAGGRRLLGHAALWAAIGAAVFGAAGPAIPSGADPTDIGPLLSAAYRMMSWVLTTPLFAVMAVAPFLVGIWAARLRLLDEPERHRPLLRRTAVIGVAAAVLGGVPLAVLNSGLAGEPGMLAVSAATGVHTLTGYFGGLGYAAIIALVAVRIGERRGFAVRALAACGQRSMSCYLAQSVAWLILFEPYLAGLGGSLHPLVAAGVGTGVWAVTVLLAYALHRAGRAGPAEALLRRLSYGPRHARVAAG
ncbi:DUF418 domain-containing protein [Allonocardiopsis opalescens]|uniref:Putative membrane protein YeiB n=1 Tax=Allonocardiopsis opalescens TaxID=1144618 RepID=A0A2T0Q6V6_9ACTN|nr:DUF418 domain-containing protein [Allonocardiopsis opalescens]PRX99534.1 putative membrane protein YeiB [Allonocardiopsis opalescens]